mmetsp:Transcript_48517/g.144917  ORF Transcript_48517/g.144917 Transcript_48517/m.144917 type:complete len:480 (-) Transcript_48517:20-1459(-)
MLDFRKGYAGVFVALRFQGTAWPYGILPGMISALIGLGLTLHTETNDLISQDEDFMVNHYPFQLFAYLVGFFIVFRANHTYRRYWQALEAVQVMGARWLACACLVTAGDSTGAADASTPYLAQSATRRPQHTEAPDVKDEAGPPHPSFFTEVVHLFSLMHALALQHLRMLPRLEDLQDSPWDDGQWLRIFDAAAVLSPVEHILCSSLEPCPSWGSDLKLKVLGRLSADELRVLSLDSGGNKIPGDVRVSMVESWLMRRFIARQKHEPAGDLKRTSPPILSRIYALISDGALAFGQAKKFAEVPFPFPYHNLKEAFLWIYAATVPIVVNAKINHVGFRFIVNFVAVWAYFAMSKVGDDLEDPFFDDDPNDLPLFAIHNQFNVQLLSYGMVPTIPAETTPPVRAATGDDGATGGINLHEVLAPRQHVVDEMQGVSCATHSITPDGSGSQEPHTNDATARPHDANWSPLSCGWLCLGSNSCQ